MATRFELDTLKMRIAQAELQPLDLHQRIQRALQGLILDGTLAPGLRLPATRSLATALGVARDTVENAYVQLQRDGYIARQQGSGSFVSDSLGQRLRGAPAQRRAPRPAAATATPASGLSRRGEAILASGGIQDHRQVRAFATGLPETRSFPLATWTRLQRQAQKDTGALLHGDPQGCEALRTAIATYLNLERGARCSPDQVLVLSSTRQGLFLCAQLLVDEGRPILLEDPGYIGARRAFEAAGTRVLPIPVDAQGLSTEALRADRSGASCVYVTPSHQYPTGATLPLQRRLELIGWAAERRGWIIEDDYDSEFHYDGLPTACVQGLDDQQRTLYLGTLSKALYPGLRLGYMVLPPALVPAFTHARSIIDGHSPQVLQLTLARFMEDGHYNAHVRAMRKLYAQRQGVLVGALERHLPNVVQTLRPPGGLQLPCLLAEGWTEARTQALAARAGLLLPGLSRLYLGAEKRQGWLLGYSALSDHEIEGAVRRLADALGA
ncbi:PLP-dependent aminotransferase family protein [Pseudomonas otitidis]|uniref:PLP-dependent aminotransferase family protein n=1 Tax=Metapseudomonas otitidis TaxID=319939 RepID=A0ABU3XX53_9GAMM|nr:PLP-dependent aminotransferase family protein [Pseudomonas otitidis]MDV3442503.1 PLP-dependent aminotransferase family protein [Pseudomonas otitidis]